MSLAVLPTKRYSTWGFVDAPVPLSERHEIQLSDGSVHAVNICVWTLGRTPSSIFAWAGELRGATSKGALTRLSYAANAGRLGPVSTTIWEDAARGVEDKDAVVLDLASAGRISKKTQSVVFFSTCFVQEDRERPELRRFVEKLVATYVEKLKREDA